MSSELALLTVVIAIAGGVIAFLGDLLGKALGKRRASLLGIRPRYTAAIISTISGIAVAIVAVAVLLAASSDVRDALLKFGRVQADLERAQQAREQAIAARDEARAELNQVQGQLKRAQGELADSLAARDEAVAARRRAEAEAQRSRDAAQRLRRNVAELAARRDALQAEVEELRKLADGLARGARLYQWWTSPQGEVIVDADERLAWIRIPRGSTRQAIVEAIARVITDAEQQAKALGALPLEGDERRRYIWLAPLEGYGVPRRMSPEQLEQALVAELRGRPNDALLFVVATLPGKRGGPILADFVIADIKLVFHRGEVIAEVAAELPPGATHDERLDAAVDAVRELLSRARYNAIEKGMIVPRGGRFGAFSFSQVLHIAERILAAQPPARVRMVATEDVFSNDVLARAVSIEVVGGGR